MGYDEDYRTTDAYFGAAPDELLVAHRHRLDRSRPVLDIGAGQGRHALYLAADGFEVHAIDPSAVAIETIDREAARQGLRVSARQVGFDEFTPAVASYAGVLAFGLFPLLRPAEIETLVRRLERWTAAGSHLFLTAFTTEDPAFVRCRDGWRALDAGSFEGPDGAVRTFLSPGELPGLFPSFRPVHHREYLGPEHRHGDGPVHRHGRAEAVLVR